MVEQQWMTRYPIASLIIYGKGKEFTGEGPLPIEELVQHLIELANSDSPGFLNELNSQMQDNPDFGRQIGNIMNENEEFRTFRLSLIEHNGSYEGSASRLRYARTMAKRLMENRSSSRARSAAT